MDKDKQIEEMAKALTRYEYSLCERLPKDKCLLTSAVHAQVSCDYCKIAEFLVKSGYRKAEGVAREIFEEIEKMLNIQAIIACETRKTASETEKLLPSYIAMLDGRIYSLSVVEEHIAELKKKYTEGENNGN